MMSLETLSYAISLLFLIVFLYYSQKSKFIKVLENKKKEIKNSLHTCEYIKNFSIFTLYEESKSFEAIDDEIEKIENIINQKIKLLRAELEKELKIIKNRYESDFNQHVKKINAQLIKTIKAEIANEIFKILIIKLKNHDVGKLNIKKLNIVR